MILYEIKKSKLIGLGAGALGLGAATAYGIHALRKDIDDPSRLLGSLNWLDKSKIIRDYLKNRIYGYDDAIAKALTIKDNLYPIGTAVVKRDILAKIFGTED